MDRPCVSWPFWHTYFLAKALFQINKINFSGSLPIQHPNTDTSLCVASLNLTGLLAPCFRNQATVEAVNAVV